MKQTESISLGGYSFIIGKDALGKLEEYIRKVEASSSEDVRAELVSDIEERLAELFIEKYGKGSVLDIEAVEAVTSIIGVPESEEGESSSTSTSSSSDGSSTETQRPRRKIYRNMNDRLLGGVCSGIASYFGLETNLLRTVLAVFGAISLIGRLPQTAAFLVVAYVIAWAIIPVPRNVEEQCEFEGKPLHFDDFKDRAESLKDTVKDSAERLSNEARTAPLGHALGRGIAVCCGVILVLVGIAALVAGLFFAFDFPLDSINFIALDRYIDAEPYYEFFSFFTDPIVKWTFVAILGLFGLGQLYGGVSAIFDLKSPKWRPGLIIFLLWCTAVIVFTLYITKHVLLFNNFITV